MTHLDAERIARPAATCWLSRFRDRARSGFVSGVWHGAGRRGALSGAAQDGHGFVLDLTGSTALGETLDPERLRALLARYFERMKTIVERHGGRWRSSSATR